jgi:hypothetical protein
MEFIGVQYHNSKKVYHYTEDDFLKLAVRLKIQPRHIEALEKHQIVSTSIVTLTVVTDPPRIRKKATATIPTNAIAERYFDFG